MSKPLAIEGVGYSNISNQNLCDCQPDRWASVLSLLTRDFLGLWNTEGNLCLVICDKA